MQLINRGDIFYADLRESIKSEVGGIRPVVVIQNDIGNKYLPTVIVAPITSNINNKNIETRIFISKKDILPTDGLILLEQVRTIDKVKLKEKIGHADKILMNKVEKALNFATGIQLQNINKKTRNIGVAMESNYKLELEYKDIYSSINDIKEMMKGSNYIGNKIKEWICSGVIGAILGAIITALIGMIIA